MKYIKSNSIFCMFLASSIYLNAQDVQNGLPMLLTDSLQAEQDEVVQVAFKQVNEKDLLGGVSFVNMEELMEKNYITYSLSDMQG